MNKKKVYISGPMRGYEEFNFPAFAKACSILREQNPEMEVISPHEMDSEMENIARFDPKDFDPESSADVKNHLRTVLKRDAEVVLDSDIILTLDGWKDSKGACAEVMLAHAAGIPNKPWEQEAYSPPPLLALCGPKGVGKSTFADRACKDHYKWSFAQPLRDMLYQLPIDREHFNSRKEEPIQEFNNINGRLMLQTLGTEWGRTLDPNIWVTCMRIRIENLEDGNRRGLPVGNCVVVDDLRFDNEATMLKEKGFKIWKVNREGFTPKRDDHKSEDGISNDLIDKVINV